MGLLDRFDVTNGPVRSLAMGTLRLKGVEVGSIVPDDFIPPPPKPDHSEPYIFKREKISRTQATKKRIQTRLEPDPICPISGTDHYWRGRGVDAYTTQARQQCKECKVTRLTPEGWVKPERKKKL